MAPKSKNELATSPARKEQVSHIEVRRQPGESLDAATARIVLQPAVSAAGTANAYRPFGLEPIPLGCLISELASQCEQVSTGNFGRPEAMLMAQAQSLDAIFNRLANQAASHIGSHANMVDPYLRLALKAQSQCRTTLETLAAIKNPPVIYARQANISHGHQQVNNGVSQPAPSSQAGESGTRPNELLEAQHGERLDPRATGKAGRGHPEVAAVVTVDRAKDRKRQGQG